MDWEVRDKRNSYIVNFQDIALVISQRTVGDHILELINGDGDVIESLSVEPYSATEEIFQEKYDICRRQALDIDGIINKTPKYLKPG